MGLRLTRVATAGLIALLAAGGPVLAAEPSVAGLWQKIDDETGKTVIWFLFLENGPAYDGVAAKLFPRPATRRARRFVQAARTTARARRCSACQSSAT